MLKETYISNAENVDGILFQVTRSHTVELEGALYVPELAPTLDLLSAKKYEKMPWDEYSERFREQILTDEKAMATLREIFEISKVADVYLVCYEKKYPCHRFILLELIEEKWGGERDRPAVIPTEVVIDTREQNFPSGKAILLGCAKEGIKCNYEYMSRQDGDLKVELGDYILRNRLYGEIRIEYMTMQDAYNKWLGTRRGALQRQIHDLLEDFGENAKLVVNLNGVDLDEEIYDLTFKHLQSVNDEYITVIMVKDMVSLVSRMIRQHTKMVAGEYKQRAPIVVKRGPRTRKIKIDILCQCPHVDIKRSRMILNYFDDDVINALANVDKWIEIHGIGKKTIDKVKKGLKTSTNSNGKKENTLFSFGKRN